MLDSSSYCIIKDVATKYKSARSYCNFLLRLNLHNNTFLFYFISNTLHLHRFLTRKSNWGHCHSLKVKNDTIVVL